MSPRTRRLVAGTALALLTAGCGGTAGAGPAAVPAARVADGQDDGFAGTLLVDPAVPRPALVLPDTTGRPYDLAAQDDGVTALFFGYTRCPDVCPTAMADLAAARRVLPEALSDRVEVVFVTEDPQRDTPQVLRRWLDRFDEDVVGLLGGTPETARVLDALHLPRSQAHADPPGASPHPHPEGDLDHSGVVYLFGPDDRRTVVHSGGTTPQQYAADLRALLTG